MSRIAVLASGRGSNLQALIDAGLPIACVITDRGTAGALDRATEADIPAQFVDPKDYQGREPFDAAVQSHLDSYGVDLILLAGFMRILSSGFVQRWGGRMVNIHPSLLPKYRGLHTHRRVLENRDHEHGASVHFVNEELDGGPVILQARVPVLPGDDEAALAQRVQAEEHRVYPWVASMLVQGRIVLIDGQVILDGTQLPAPLTVHQETDLSCLAA